MSMRASQKCLNMIKSFEGCVLTAYKCVPSEEYYTIGYGHYGSDVRSDMRITKEVAESYLNDDIKRFETLVNIYSGYNFNQNEFDALVSFAYNIGSIKQLTKDGTRTKSEIADAMLLYTHDGAGRELAGLVNRRKVEHDLFITPCDNDKTTFTESSTIKDIVDSVLRGEQGNNEERKNNIYNIIQSFVNKRLGV